MKRVRVFRNLGMITLFLIAIWFMRGNWISGGQYLAVTTSAAEHVLEQKDNISSVQIEDRTQEVKILLKSPAEFYDSHGAIKRTDRIVATFPTGGLEDAYQLVKSSGARQWDADLQQPSSVGSLVQAILPTLIIGGLIVFFLSSMVKGGGRGGFMGIGRARSKRFTKDMVKTTFADVAGAESAVEELQEIKDILKYPEKYQEVGAKVPRGVLLYGPPGTGKTLLARAVAGEAEVPFFSVSGSDFIEMFAGVGSGRMRDLFEQAKQDKPCIIFIDELDAIGRKRHSGGFGGNDEERHQTLNQMLVEMDGFESRDGIIVIAATNRPDTLDPALLRPGRFDRQIPINNPSLQGRKDILRIHAKGKTFTPDADLDELAKRTMGMSGAELENLLNEAALLTARENKKAIDWTALNEAIDRIQLGPRNKSRVISEHERKVAAYHEAGHTLAAWATQGLPPVYKVTIVQRGNTGGHAMTVPEDDKMVYTRTELIGKIIMALGGRVAEELVFGEQTTGASSDIEQATKIARAMVTEYGMSLEAGPILYGKDDSDALFPQDNYRGGDYSPEVSSIVDAQVRAVITAAHDEVWHILSEYRDILDQLADELLREETLTRTDLERIFAQVDKRPRVSVFNDFGKHKPSEKLPILTPVEKAGTNGTQESAQELVSLNGNSADQHVKSSTQDHSEDI